MVNGRKRRSLRQPGARPLYQHAAEALSEILARTAPGTYLPSEPTLARTLGVSRATLREAMRAFEERGQVIRRQGVGTVVTEQPQVIDTGLEVLESIETLAAHIGLVVTMGELAIQERNPNADEAQTLALDPAGHVLQVSRVILADGRPVAYLVDVLPATILRADILGREFNGSVLDLLLRQGSLALDKSRTEITAVSASGEVARRFSIQRGDVLLRFEADLYTKEGLAIAHSLSFFLPGTFRFHVVRRVERP
jgi:GntR family transcriptional regulator